MSELLPWIKIESLTDLPKKPGLRSYEQIDCIIMHKGEMKFRVWNCEHGVWDDSEGDDFYCGPLEPTHYFVLMPPAEEQEKQTEKAG